MMMVLALKEVNVALRIVTDSACGLTETDRHRLPLETVPLRVFLNGAPVSEDELQDLAFYARLDALAHTPSTSQPSPEEFIEVFRRITAGGDDVLAVLISGDMSGTFQSAELAARTVIEEGASARIEVLDSRSNSLEEGFAVMAAAEAAAQGGALDECRGAALEVMRRTRFLFTPASLDYLRRGGRISGAAGLLGVMLKIAPILTAEKGQTAVAGVKPGRRSAITKIADLMRGDIERAGLRRAVVQYIVDRDEAVRFAAEHIEPIAKAPVPVIPIPVVVGLHVGPAVGVVYETERPLR